MLVIDKEGKYSEIFNMNLPDDASDVIIMLKEKKTSSIIGGFFSTIYHNCNTGMQSYARDAIIRENKKYFIYDESSNETLKGFFSIYNEKYDVFVLLPAVLKIKSQPTVGDICYWEYPDNKHFAYVFSRDRNIYIPFKEENIHRECIEGLDVYAGTYYSGGINNIAKEHKKSIGEARKFFGYTYNQSENDLSYSLINPYTFGYLITSYGKIDTAFPEECLDIISMPLSDLSNDVKNKMFKVFKLTSDFETMKEKSIDNLYMDYKSYYHRIYFSTFSIKYDFATICKVADNIACIRIFGVNADINALDVENLQLVQKIDDVDISENIRIYVYNNDYFICKRNFDKWEICKEHFNLNCFDFVLIDVDENAVKDTKLKYYLEYIDECLKINKVDFVELFEDISRVRNKLVRNTYFVHVDCKLIKEAKVSFIKFFSVLDSNILESLLKSEYKCFHDIYLNTDFSMNNHAFLNFSFGLVDNRENSFIKAIGVPAFVFKEVNDEYYKEDCINGRWTLKTILFLKMAFCNNLERLRNINYDDFIKIFNLYFKFGGYIDSVDSVEELGTLIYFLVELSGSKNVFKHMENAFYICDKLGVSSFIEYADYVEMLFNLRHDLDCTQFNYEFKSKEELTLAHTQVLNYYNAIEDQKEEGKYKEKFDEMVKVWDTFKYSEEEYSIIIPTNYTQIVNEGITLRHCVKSYVNSILDGKTTILFVRKTDELDKPFFTLEVKDNKIRQCHGFANCNTNTVEGLDSFLMRFCKDKNIEYNNTSKALPVG